MYRCTGIHIYKTAYIYTYIYIHIYISIYIYTHKYKGALSSPALRTSGLGDYRVPGVLGSRGIGRVSPNEILYVIPRSALK